MSRFPTGYFFILFLDLRKLEMVENKEDDVYKRGNNRKQLAKTAETVGNFEDWSPEAENAVTCGKKARDLKEKSSEIVQI